MASIDYDIEYTSMSVTTSLLRAFLYFFNMRLLDAFLKQRDAILDEKNSKRKRKQRLWKRKQKIKPNLLGNIEEQVAKSLKQQVSAKKRKMESKKEKVDVDSDQKSHSTFSITYLKSKEFTGIALTIPLQ